MSSFEFRVLVVTGSASSVSAIKSVTKIVAERLAKYGAHVDVLDLAETPLPMFNPETAYLRPDYGALKQRVEAAHALILGTPDYHGSFSSVLKNFLDHFWQEYSGKLFATVVASYDKGLTVTDQLRTVARQCYAWFLPYSVCFVDQTDVKDGKIFSAAFDSRLEMLVRDVRVYGELIARQRQSDLVGVEPGFLARLRNPEQ
jgi:NAD(P)H-dependent FMN reductase